MDDHSSEHTPNKHVWTADLTNGLTGDDRAEADGLTDYLILAAEDTLKDRDLAIFDKRYGLSGDEGQTLQEIGTIYGLTRERIRQIVARSLRRLVDKGSRQLRRDELTEPCAQLVSYVRDPVCPGEDGEAERLLYLATEEVGHLGLQTQAIPLLAYIVGGKAGAKRYRSLVADRLKMLRRQQRQEKAAEAKAAEVERLLQDVVWPHRTSRIKESALTSFSSQRDISETSLGYTGVFYSHKLQREVAYESSLEQKFLEWLEAFEDVVFYQEQPLRISYQIDGLTYTYYPDVFFVLRNGHGVVVEIKSRNEMALYGNWIKWAALRDYCNHKGYGWLVTNGRYSLQYVGKRPVREAVREILLAVLQSGPLHWPDYKILRQECGITSGELYALIIKERLIWQLRPFRLALTQL